jgi:hypothetical protein
MRMRLTYITNHRATSTLLVSAGYTSVLARVSRLTDAQLRELRELRESRHEFMLAEARAKPKRR